MLTAAFSRILNSLNETSKPDCSCRVIKMRISCKTWPTPISATFLVRQSMTKQTKWPVRPAKTMISLGIRPVWSVFTVRFKCTFFRWTAKTLIRLGGWPCWSGSLLDSLVILLILSCSGSNGRQAESYIALWKKSCQAWGSTECTESKAFLNFQFGPLIQSHERCPSLEV